jgi:acyl-CoA synthetase (AMP-forming)/AMP-acid ligase II
VNPLASLRDAGEAMVDGVPALWRSGVLRPVDPRRLPGMARGALRSGPTFAAVIALGAGRHPDRPAVIDEDGAITYAQLADEVERVAGALHAEHGIGADDTVGIQCRNHRGFVLALGAASRLGADVVLLNTDFSGRQLSEVLEREGVDAVLADAEFLPALDEHGFTRPVVESRFADLGRAPRPAPRPRRTGRAVLLTSGTTGTPKGAGRAPSSASAAGPLITILANVPVRAGERVLVGPPLFHAFGLAFGALGLAVGMTLVVRRRFDAAEALELVERERAAVVCGVPVMLQRLLAGNRATPRDTSSLAALVSGGAPLSPALANELMDEFGDIVFNLYGSTETGWGGIALPRDLREAPGTVGRAPLGTSVRILDEAGRELGRGETGRIFVRTGMLFEQYTGGGTKEVVDGFMSTGDMGRLDAEGRLFIEGRDDDMIVSGGENVFPQEVQDALAAHEAVDDVAVVGVEDEKFGQRLAAYVVLADGARVSADDLRAHVKDNLARYKVPRDVEFVEAIPRNPTGKIVKRRLTGAGA